MGRKVKIKNYIEKNELKFRKYKQIEILTLEKVQIGTSVSSEVKSHRTSKLRFLITNVCSSNGIIFPNAAHAQP